MEVINTPSYSVKVLSPTGKVLKRFSFTTRKLSYVAVRITVSHEEESKGHGKTVMQSSIGTWVGTKPP